MLALAVLLLAGLLFGVAAVSVGHGSPLSETVPDRREPTLPADRLRADDIQGLRFSMAVRGYRMDEVDEVLDRLSTELSVRDAEISRLHTAAGAPVAPMPETGDATVEHPGDPAAPVYENPPLADPTLGAGAAEPTWGAVDPACADLDAPSRNPDDPDTYRPEAGTVPLGG